MAVSRDHELLGIGRILQRLWESHVSGMLKKEVDHRTSKGGPPTLALGDFFPKADPFLFILIISLWTKEQPQRRWQNIQAAIYSQEEKEGKPEAGWSAGPAFSLPLFRQAQLMTQNSGIVIGFLTHQNIFIDPLAKWSVCGNTKEISGWCWPSHSLQLRSIASI